MRKAVAQVPRDVPVVGRARQRGNVLSAPRTEGAEPAGQLHRHFRTATGRAYAASAPRRGNQGTPPQPGARSGASDSPAGGASARESGCTPGRAAASAEDGSSADRKSVV